jgi:LPXTG-motif cell wall-anchored protein
MKRTISLIAAIMLLIATVSVTAQEQPAPKKDTVNMDTYAKPEKFYEIEDDTAGETGKGGSTGVIIAVVAGVIVIAGAAGYFLTRKKR